ncbi:MAG: hypothetical protein SFV51_07950 [Bryobacteraceae bacterium]|nr:hypothetical protein [Bryobacteraceae bacterium]
MQQFLLSMMLAGTLAFAQGGPGTPGGQGAGSQQRQRLQINISASQTIQGEITAVQVAFGVQYPSIVVNGMQIKLAPVWFLLDNDFELKVGEQVRVIAAPSTQTRDNYLYAINVTKVTGNQAITLRDNTGMPLWTQRASGRAGSATAPRTGVGCVDPASVRTVTGIVEQLTAGAGIQFPSLVLALDNDLVSVKLGPERILLNNDFELRQGMRLTVKYGLATCTQENVALQITDSDGYTLILRNDDGTPVWN